MSAVAQALPQRFPRALLLGAGALVLFAFAAAWTGRNLDVGATHMAAQAPYEVLQLTFVDGDDGSVFVRDAQTGATLYWAAPGTNGFLRSALRGFARERIRDGLSASRPFTLTRWRDGTLSLQDEAIQRRIDLDAFGATQAGDFARLFSAKEIAK